MKGEDSETLSVGTVPTIPGVGDLQRLWNELAEPAGLPLWKETGTGRMRSAKSRLRERPSMPEWRRIIERIATSTFCRGESGRGEWRASPDWLLRPDTAAKVLEGKYDDRAPPKPASQSYVEDRRPKPTMTEEEVRELFARSAAQRNGTG